MLKHKMLEVGIHSFLQSTRRYSSPYYMAAAGSDIGIKERHPAPNPPGPSNGFSSMSGNQSDQRCMPVSMSFSFI